MKQIAGIPQLGLGTYGRTGAAGRAAMVSAIEIGYRHLDTAQGYFNEAEVGAATRESGLPRSDFFITTKIDMKNFGEGKLVPSLEKSCEQAGVEQFDLTLIHWPSPRDEVPLAVYLRQLAEARDKGLTRLIGVSNFTIRHLKVAIGVLGDGAIATNQVELHPYLQNKKLADFCTANGIAVTCYQPIAHGRLRGDPVIEAIARAHDASVEQVALAFEMAKGYITIPASGRREHLQSNFDATELLLAEDEIARIETVDKGQRYVQPSWTLDWD